MAKLGGVQEEAGSARAWNYGRRLGAPTHAGTSPVATDAWAAGADCTYLAAGEHRRYAASQARARCSARPDSPRPTTELISAVG